MRIPPDLAERLRLVAYAAGGSEESLADSLDDFVSAALAAVPSLVAVSVSVESAGAPVTVMAYANVTSARGVVTSLRLRLPGTAAEITVHASEPAALTQLAADLPVLLDIHRSRVEVTDRAALRPAFEVSPALGADLADVSVVNRALGVLLEQGLLLDEGAAELERRAELDGLTVPETAGLLLAGLPVGPQTDRGGDAEP